MNVLSLNIRGIGEDHKRSWVKRLCIENKVKFVGLQETMSRDDNKFLIQSLWKNSKFAYFTKKADGRVALSLFGTLHFFPHLQLLRGTGLWQSQHLKSSIKKWRSDIQCIESATAVKLRGKLDDLDNKAEVGPLTPTDATARIDIVRELTSLERIKVMDLRQKAKFHESKFKETSNRRPTFTSNLFKHISVEDSNLLDRTITPQEIKDAIWDCGGDKAPGPDGFTFKFIKKHWEIIKDDIIAYVKEFENTSYFPRGCNSSFITLIPKIDDPLTIGEFRPISLIGCQHKIIAKILTNRLSLVIPSLNAMNLFRILTCFNLTSGLKINFHKSKLYGVGVTSLEVNSLASMICCLPSKFTCTYLGLLIGGNMSRCANWGILVDKFNKRLSNWKAMSLSFGGRFTLIKFVPNIISVYYFFTFKDPNKIINNLEGIRRIFFWGGTTDENKIAWIAWDKATSSISNGGLGIGTLKSSNHAMLSKWWWRFHTENHAFWCKIIRSIHGVDGGLNDTSLIKSKSGPWYRIAKLKDDLSKIGIDLPSIFKKKIGDGCSTRFWLDTWLGGSPLKDTFPRLFRLDSNPSCLVCNRCPTFQPLTHVSSAATSQSAPTFTPPIGLIFNWAWSRPIRSSLELCELSELCSLVAHLRLSDNSDSWECIIDDSRAFSVKMMRSYINQKFPTLQPENILLVSREYVKVPDYKNKALHTRIATYSDQARPDLTFVSTSWRHPWDPTLGITLRKMSAMANTTPIVTTVTKPTTKEKTPKEADATPRSAFDRLNDTYSPSTTKSGSDRSNSRDLSHNKSRPRRRDSSNRDRPRNKDRSRGVEESHDNTRSSYGQGPNIDTAATETTPVMRKMGGKVNPRHPAYQRAAPAMGDTGSQGQKDTSLRRRMTWRCPGYVKRVPGGSRAARVWFDELLPESIDGYKDLKAALLAYFMQQKKYVKDPVEIHNIKQRDGETIEEFMERFKVETGRMKGTPECMRISRFMHGVNNPELTKRLNEHVPKTMEETMITTTAFIRGEAAAASKKKGHTSWRTQDQSKRHGSERRSDFRGREQPKVGKKEVPAKDKSMAIYMIQPWHRVTRRKITQSFERVSEITFPSLTTSSRTEGPLVKEAEIGGHMIHRMYVDGGSSTEVLYKHCFNQLRPEINNQMVPATTSLTGFSGETIWPLGQLRLLVTIGDVDHSTKSWMNFMIVRSLSPYNGIIGRPRIREIQAVLSTAHEMLKFPVDGGVVTIRSTILIPADPTSGFPGSGSSNQRHAIRERADGSMLTPEEKLRYICMTAVRYDRSPAISSGTSTQYPRRIFTCSTEKKGQAPDRAKAIQVETPEAEQAFKQLKQHLSKLPLLVAPNPKEELIVYLSASYKAVSAVLMTKRGTVQTPVYFVSRALQGPELNYTPMEKLVLSLVFAAKRLRRYSQVHPIAVITDQPIKQIISCPDVVGRLQKWSVMLGEHNITYRPRTSMKGQILADFLGEKSDENPPDTLVVETSQEPWTLFTDRSSCVDGLGAGLIVTSPEGTKFTYALRFQFTASNNEAEYEALIAGLRIAAQMGVRNVQVLVEILKDKSILEKEVEAIVEEEGPTWMTPIIEYLKDGTIPGDRKEASKLCIKARQYELLEGVLYRRSFLKPWLRCIGPLQAEYVIREIHEGSCSMHAGPRSVVAKAMRLGYYWSTMHRGAQDMIRACNDCQIHRPMPRNPQHPLTPITAPWLFYKWGIDIAGPFPEGPRNVKFFIVAIDYFTKWIEAKSVATITGNQVKKFVWDNIVCRFGLPGEIISDNDKQFSDNPFKDWCEKLNIAQRFASVKHPQSNGLMERANRSLGEGIKARLGEENKNWTEELPYVLWAHRIMIKSSHGDTPFSLTYETEAVILTEIGMPTYRTAAVDAVHNDEELWLNLDLLEEKYKCATICEAKAKLKMTRYYNARVRGVTFRPGDFVYRSNDASHAVIRGKLSPNWEGPYEVTEAFGDGVYRLKSMDGEVLPRTWNIANLKKCYF
ncbi:reverse transcriptase domain-containing protein [Tanacetum coccineum]